MMVMPEKKTAVISISKGLLQHRKSASRDHWYRCAAFTLDQRVPGAICAALLPDHPGAFAWEHTNPKTSPFPLQLRVGQFSQSGTGANRTTDLGYYGKAFAYE